MGTKWAQKPVLPMVLYTGRRPWPALGRLLDLVEIGSEFAEVIPALQPQTLLRQLRHCFGELPPETVAIIERTSSATQLDAWLDRFAIAASLADVGIG